LDSLTIKKEGDLRKLVRSWFPRGTLYFTEFASGGDQGIPDFFVFHRCEVHFIELKCLDKEPRSAGDLNLRTKQIRFLGDSLASGINAGVIVGIKNTELIYFYDGKLVVDTLNGKENRSFKGRRIRDKLDLISEIEYARKFRNKT
jgi:hypothetical protein